MQHQEDLLSAGITGNQTIPRLFFQTSQPPNPMCHQDLRGQEARTDNRKCRQVLQNPAGYPVQRCHPEAEVQVLCLEVAVAQEAEVQALLTEAVSRGHLPAEDQGAGNQTIQKCQPRNESAFHLSI